MDITNSKYIAPIYMYHNNWNTIAIVHHDGVHRVYKENKAKDTTLYLNRKGQYKVKLLLQSIGYKEVSITDFNNYFKKKA